jgi:hypothetical protein
MGVPDRLSSASTAVTTPSPMPAMRAPWRVASCRSRVWTSDRRATFRSSAANAGAAVRTSAATSAGPPRDSMNDSRRCTRWLLTCVSQARRRSSVAIDVVAKGSSPYTSACARMISPYSSGKASSDRRNSSSGRTSGVASCARCQRDDSRAHASRSDSDRLDTSARHASGASLSPSRCGPYATIARRRLLKTLLRSSTSTAAVIFGLDVMSLILPGLGSGPRRGSGDPAKSKVGARPAHRSREARRRAFHRAGPDQDERAGAAVESD